MQKTICSCKLNPHWISLSLSLSVSLFLALTYKYIIYTYAHRHTHIDVHIDLHTYIHIDRHIDIHIDILIGIPIPNLDLHIYIYIYSMIKEDVQLCFTCMYVSLQTTALAASGVQAFWVWASGLFSPAVLGWCQWTSIVESCDTHLS